ncbi:type IV pilus modification PilV family protein [Ruficoccus amylovorans]|nr:prepilin-type N-terminal cleavage/methylation domain-containing protein [Ruficoccus amylovorans]
MHRGRHPKSPSKHPGFSLVEVMIGMSILVIVAAATTSAVFVSRMLAESSIYQNTSFTVAQGYVEQIKSIEYVLLTNALDNYESHKGTVGGWDVLSSDAYQTNSIAEKVMLDTRSIDSSESGVASETEFETRAPLYIGAWVERNVLIDIRNPGENNQHELLMPMRFKVEMTNLSDTTENVDALEITLLYSYQTNIRGDKHWYDGELRFVRCNAPTF